MGSHMKHLICVASCALALSLDATAQGPTGFGPLKLGMTKEAIESLQASEGIYLSSSMTPYQYKSSAPKEGVDKFNALLITPLSSESVNAVLTFELSQLTELYMTLPSSSNMLERIKAQITEKYGVGKVEDTMEEEQCIYKNGANFKLSSGVISTTWTETSSQADQVEARLSDIVLATCPSSLRYDMHPIKLKSLTIRKIKPSAETKPKNLF